MTSANLSWVDKVKANKKIMSNRNLWTFVLVLPVVFIAFIVPTVLWFIRTTNYGNIHSQSAEQIDASQKELNMGIWPFILHLL